MASATIQFGRVRGLFARSSVALLVLHSAVGPLAAVIPVFAPHAFAVSNIFSDGFGTGEDDDTFDESPAWTEDEAGAEKREATSGNDSASPDGGRFAVMFGNNGYICTTIDATGYNDVELSYYWRGDSDAGGSSDNAIVEVKSASGNGCDNSSGWTTLQDHDMRTDSSWSTQGAFTNAAFNNTSFLLRFRTSTNASDEHFRVDGVLVTGTPTTGTIVIVKNAVPDDAQDFAFTSDVPGNTSFTLDDDGEGGSATSNTKTMSSVTAGTYAVSEGAVTGWTQTSATCSDGSPVTAIVLSAGETVTCTFTNTKLGTVTIVKNANPDDAQDFSFTSTLPGGSTFSLDDDGEGGALPNSVTYTSVPLGGYTITEDAATGWSLTGVSCTGGDADGSTSTATRTATIDVDAGEAITCTFTNTKYGTLRINKDAVGGDAEFDFTIDEEGGDGLFETSIQTTEGEGFVEVSLPAADYGVTETLPSGEDWQMESNGCAFPVVSPGQTTECTVTNVKKSQIQVRKQTVNGFGSFHFQGTIDSSDTDIGGEDGFDLTTSEGNNPIDTFFDVFVDSEGGDTVILTENQSSSDGWELTGMQCLVDDSPTGEGDGSTYNFNIQPGATAICTFTNTLAQCGNSSIEETEQCDDGNVTGEDGCSSTCQIESGWACTSEPSSCTTDCGDGVTAGSEQCDDNNNEDGDGCTAACVIEVCGDSVVNDTEETCDDGNATGEDGFSRSCQTETGYSCPTPGEACGGICGDGLVRGAEACDDGDANGEDGCSSTCTVEDGFQCDNDPEPSQCEVHLDFGDAPDAEGEGSAYPTLLEHNGARHMIVSGIYLGESIDGEPDGQPNSDATGDDVSGEDDEDGVTFNDALVPGTTAGITVDASTGEDETDYFLDAWFDWNQDEDWADEGEHVLLAEALSDGENAFEVSVPSDAVLGDTFARFRMSDEEGEGVGVTGLENTGEVEDYKVTIAEQASSSSEPGEGSSSSSSVSSNEESSSPSEGGGSSATVITGLGIPDGGPAGGNGSTLGHQTHMGKAFNRFLAALHLSGPQGAFGAGTSPLSPEQKAYLCSIQRALPNDASDGFLQAIAADAATYVGRPVGFVIAKLLDPNLCSSITASLIRQTENVVVMPKPFYLAGDGLPHSWTNDTWNKCIRGTATISDIRANPLRPDGVGVDCAAMHTADMWYHPDLHMYFTFTPPSGKKAMKLGLPHDYIAVKDGKLVMK
ncbi:DUF4215 domain-containing protein [Candidatus Peregrinibacteria bacterium]|nr:DUF4215 domain-containing protein [Candidatus Peregrinibacteria bacterium]